MHLLDIMHTKPSSERLISMPTLTTFPAPCTSLAGFQGW